MLTVWQLASHPIHPSLSRRMNILNRTQASTEKASPRTLWFPRVIDHVEALLFKEPHQRRFPWDGEGGVDAPFGDGVGFEHVVWCE